jgi:hypothetical protein
MQKHLNRKRSCIPGKDMKLINVNDLCVERKTEKLDHLTQEEKDLRCKNQSKEIERNKRKTGYLTEDEYAKQLLENMKRNTIKRNIKRKINNLPLHELPSWSSEEVLKILQENSIYKITDTIIGTLEIPMKLTNGYFNSASFDRIDDNIGYNDSNYEIRPFFLNCRYKLTTEDLKDLVILREQIQDETELKELLSTSYQFFYQLAHGAKSSVEHKSKKITFDFKLPECAAFLKKLWIEQGGRCAYSNVPIYPIVKHKHKISIERKNPNKGYTRDNIVLITIGLNSQPAGPRNFDGQGIFNQEFWNKYFILTDEINLKCKKAKEIGRQILEKNENF